MNTTLRRYDPFDLLSRFGDATDRDSFFSPANRAEWLPPVDIKESDGEYTFHMDVPGMKPEDLDVELHEGVLSIRGSRSDEKREEDKGFVRTERRYGNFARQFRVPSNAPADSIKAEVKDGVLTITVPKGAEPSARKVKIS